MADKSRTPSPSNAAPTLQVMKRPRADTKTLLGDNYPVPSSIEPKAPLPPKKAAEYTLGRVKEGLQFAEAVLSEQPRRLSPIGEKALEVYKSACKDFLNLRDEHEMEGECIEIVKEIKKDLVATIRTYEESAQYTKCLTVTNTNSAQEMQSELIRLKKCELYSRYGDILAEACKELRKFAETKKITAWETLVGKYWTDIDKNLEKESSFWKQLLAGAKCHEDCPTHIAVWQACNGIGFDMDDMLGIIHAYSERNEFLHSPLEGMIARGDYYDLARHLYSDLTDLPRMLSLSEVEEGDVFAKVLRVMIKKWYNFAPEDCDHVQSWVPSPSLQEYRASISGKDTAEKLQVSKRITKDILDMVKKMKKAEEDGETIKKLEDIKLGTSKPKRVASSQLQKEMEKAKKQRRDFATLKNVALRYRQLSSQYSEEYGCTDDAPEIIEDPYASEESEE